MVAGVAPELAPPRVRGGVCGGEAAAEQPAAAGRRPAPAAGGVGRGGGTAEEAASATQPRSAAAAAAAEGAAEGAHAVLAAVAVVEGGVQQPVPDPRGADVRGHPREVVASGPSSAPSSSGPSAPGGADLCREVVRPGCLRRRVPARPVVHPAGGGVGDGKQPLRLPVAQSGEIKRKKILECTR